jgi:lipopolysaccharide biosynthesis glycosyltransferase
MYSEMPQEKIERFQKFVEEKCHKSFTPIKFELPEAVEIPQVLDGVYIGIETYYRLFAPFILPQEIDKILYLDVDLICTGSLAGLYNEELGNNYFIGCEDKGVGIEDLNRLELPADYHYINAGVILINLKKIREDFTAQKMVDMVLEQCKELKYLDQDFINKNFSDKIKVVSNKYNWLVKTCKYKDMPYKPVILHYAGSNKPWHDDISRYETEFIEPYYEVLALEGKTEYLEKLKKVHNENRKRLS